MANFVLIENNQITEKHDLLPINWRHVSGLSKLKDDESLLNSLGWYTVIKNNVSYDNTTHYIKSYEYSFENNRVYETPILQISDPVPEEVLFSLQLENIRSKRDKLLIETDWTQLADVQAIHNNDWKTSWANYRQQLRDLPNLCITGQINIYEVIWPIKPE